MWLLLTLLAPATAGSLDQLEVGGLFGTPATSDPTALWWNPAGVAAGSGTRFHLEGAPTLAQVDFDREDPNWGGHSDIALFGVLPFAGVASDLGIEGLGVGLALSVPMVRGGEALNPDGPSRTHLRTGNIQKIYLTAGGAYELADRVALGGTVSLIDSTWTAELDTESMTALYDQITDLGQDPGYTDADIEDPNYAARLRFGNLKDLAVTFGAGLRVEAVPERVVLSAAYHHGARIDNRGDVQLGFGCPPQEDTFGRFGAEAYGLCDATLAARARVGYDLPWRLQGGVAVEPVEDLKVELMVGHVGWSRYQDFQVDITGVAERNELDNEEAADLVEQRRRWARDNVNSTFVGLDVKGQVTDELLLGGRVLFDPSAIPDHAMTPNNYDATTVQVGVLGAYELDKRLTVGASFTHHFVQTRTVTDSAFSVTLEDRVEDRWLYPTMNGTTRARIERFGIVLKGRFGGEGEHTVED